jgi:hypothetical protein
LKKIQRGPTLQMWQWVGSCDIGKGGGDALHGELCSLVNAQVVLEGTLHIHTWLATQRPLLIHREACSTVLNQRLLSLIRQLPPAPTTLTAHTSPSQPRPKLLSHLQTPIPKVLNHIPRKLTISLSHPSPPLRRSLAVPRAK